MPKIPIGFEYGEDFSRPHFHACLFNCFFGDRKRIPGGASGSPLYRSDTLERLWPYGFSSIGDVTFESAAYVARYVMKKVTGDAAEAHYTTVNVETGEISVRTPEFNKMSLKPGIGAAWFDKFLKVFLLISPNVKVVPPISVTLFIFWALSNEVVKNQSSLKFVMYEVENIPI